MQGITTVVSRAFTRTHFGHKEIRRDRLFQSRVVQRDNNEKRKSMECGIPGSVVYVNSRTRLLIIFLF
jgi:hypothetical protein